MEYKQILVYYSIIIILLYYYIVTNEDLAGKWPAVNGCDFCG